MAALDCSDAVVIKRAYIDILRSGAERPEMANMYRKVSGGQTTCILTGKHYPITHTYGEPVAYAEPRTSRASVFFNPCNRCRIPTTMAIAQLNDTMKALIDQGAK